MSIQSTITHATGNGLEQVEPGTRARASTVAKRVFDVVLSLVCLILLLPAFVLLALIVALDSPGPVLFRQQRIGQHGRPFRILKFRSMYQSSDEQVHHQIAANWFAGACPQESYKPEHDPRVTRVGTWLRRTSLDELPQLLNVLRGEMSIVGPRPAAVYELAHYLPAYFERQAVRPGMTGLWQVSGRERLSAAEMMALDLTYVHDRSLLLDVRIILATVGVVLAPVVRACRPGSRA